MFSSTRTISLAQPEKVTLPSCQVAYPTANAMVLCDLDQDGHNELVLGLPDGWLAVYKGEHSRLQVSMTSQGLCLAHACLIDPFSIDNKLIASTMLEGAIATVTCGYVSAFRVQTLELAWHCLPRMHVRIQCTAPSIGRFGVTRGWQGVVIVSITTAGEVHFHSLTAATSVLKVCLLPEYAGPTW